MQKLTINLYLLFSIHKNQQKQKLKQPLHSKEGERNTLRNTQNGPLNQEQQEQKTGTQKETLNNIFVEQSAGEKWPTMHNGNNVISTKSVSRKVGVNIATNQIVIRIIMFRDLNSHLRLCYHQQIQILCRVNQY